MIDDGDLSRIGVSLPRDMRNEFDRILHARNYKSRSEGIRDAIRTYTINNQWHSDKNTRRKGVITLVYTCIQNDLPATIARIRNENNDSIIVSLQTLISRDRRLEVLLVEKDGVQIQALAERLRGLTGVESVKVTTIPIEKQSDVEIYPIRWDTGMEHPVSDIPD
jgi:CopG family nickel-responsive transcriptional regulator